MTITLSVWDLVLFLITPAVLIGFTIGAACMFGLMMRDPEPELMHVTLTAPLPPTRPLAPFPGEDEFSFAADFAAPIGATLDAADAFIARHQIDALGQKV